MKKILIITTGGTIAGMNSALGLAPKLLGEKLIPKLDGIETTILDLYTIDSTDVNPVHWRRLYNAVTENLPDYDGIIILHGTDTMAYTGAVLSFTVETDKPIILTGSMLPPDAPDTDAHANIQFAALVAAGGMYRGVHLAFANRIINGADIVKVSARDKDAFRSFAGFVPTKKYAFPKRNGKLPAVIRLSPFTYGLDLSITAEDRAGVVIETYGAGGLPDNEITFVVSELSKYMPIVVTTSCMGGTDLGKYEVGRRALDCGAIEGDKRSTECAAVEMWLRGNQ